MKVPFFIAQRYFQLRVKKNLIHRIGLVSFISIAVSTMALLLALSVFNGLEELVSSLFLSFDPDIKITLKKGKAFSLDTGLRNRIQAVAGVSKVVDVLEDNALLRYRERQAIVKIKGVSEEFLYQSRLAPFIKHGNFKLKHGTECFAILGIGVQYALSIPFASGLHTLQIFYPRHTQSNIVLPQQLYRCKSIKPGAVFAVEKQFDVNYVIVPIDFAAALMNMSGKRTALEIQVEDGFSIDRVQQDLNLFIPNCFQVLNRHEQQATLIQVIHIERLFVFLTFSFILLVSSLNIFFVLSMLVLGKRKDVAILYALGATPKDILYIFLIEGLWIALSGVAVGMAVALGLSWLQQEFGLVSLSTQTSLMEAYPIKRKVSDFAYTAIGVVLMTLIAAYRPAQLATKTKVRVHL
ncbi:MAG: FtsX-like permease family protein [Amoebophilaceae bacterium]|jgi:lipoprotein-releasing system permease protein|nr:FtsX-like permease family protein [Amoebophilaceae bacterium]